MQSMIRAICKGDRGEKGRASVGVAKTKELKRIRKALGKSQSELAVLLGVSTRAVQSYEQGWRPVPPHVRKLTGLLLFLKRRKDSPKLPPCWKVVKCDRDVRSRCLAYQYRAGDLCWLVSGDYIRGRKRGSQEAKVAHCRKCPVMSQWLES